MTRLTCSRVAPRANSTGMTLIELLVVIAIIAILFRISFPVFHQAKRRAQMTGCVSNLRQILQSIHMYAADYGGVPIDPFYRPGAQCWQDQLYPYVNNRQLFLCPADPRDGRAPEMRRWSDIPCSYRYCYTGPFWEAHDEQYVEPTQRSVLLMDHFHAPATEIMILGRYDGSIELAPRLRYRRIRVTFPDDPQSLIDDLNAE